MKNTPLTTAGESLEEHIGLRLRRRRLEKGLTQEAVDQRLDAARGMTRSFEAGKRFVGASDLFALSEALDVDVSFFFLGAGKKVSKSPPLAATPDVVEGAQRLVDAYYKIQDSGLRRRVVDLLRDIARDDNLNKPPARKN